MDRQTAMALLRENVKSNNLVNHMLATEFIMRSLAERFGEDPDRWGIAGLLHDIDYDTTVADMHRHSRVGSEMLKAEGLDQEICHAVLAHNGAHGEPRASLMDKALHAVDPLTGLIVATALVMPGKKLASVTAEKVVNRYREKAFAKGANREQIARCSELGMSLEDFIETCLLAMQIRANEIGL